MKTHRTKAVLAAVAVVGVAGAGLTAGVADAPPATAAPTQIRVITHNLEKKPAALAKVADLKNETFGPELILLQEVCGDMLPAVEALGGVMAFHARRSDKCDGADKRLGEAVVWTGTGAKALDPVTLLTKGDQSYGMACLDVAFSGERIRACSTHLVAGRTKEATFRGKLTAKIRRVTSPWIEQKRTVIVGGDFNTSPTFDAMDAIYGVGPSAKGSFREIAQTAGTGSTKRAGHWTSGKKTDERDTRRKIDYVFVSKNGSRTSGGSQKTATSPSNHRILYGVLPLR